MIVAEVSRSSIMFLNIISWNPSSGGSKGVFCAKKFWALTSVQDGGIGKHASPPCTATAKSQPDYKTNITQICQNIELYGSLTMKDLKKSHLLIDKWEGWRCGES